MGEVKAVSGMHQRKAEMARQADAFIALPGAYSRTFNKLFSVELCYLVTVALMASCTYNSLYRWLWNSRRTLGSNHLGSARYP